MSQPDYGRRWCGLAFCLAVAVVLTACASHPEPIEYGSDTCEYCRMLISDPRHGAELITAKGRVLKFDSIECLAAYVNGIAEDDDIRSQWVTPFEAPGTLMSVDSVFFLHGAVVSSPMGGNIIAIDPVHTTRDAAVAAYDGEVMDWPTVLERARGNLLP